MLSKACFSSTCTLASCSSSRWNFSLFLSRAFNTFLHLLCGWRWEEGGGGRGGGGGGRMVVEGWEVVVFNGRKMVVFRGVVWVV